MLKTAAPTDADSYFQQTEHAVKHLYEGLDSCWKYYKQANQHWDIRQVGQPMTPERKEALDRYLALRSSQKSAIPFCIGKERHGVPTGLIVYAARNQCNHWDDEDPHKVTKKVFSALTTAFSQNMPFDLAFDLSNPTINVYANQVLLVGLGWTSYDTYLTEIKSLLT